MQIHELNNFTGELGASAYMLVDDGVDTGKISTQNLLADTNAEINALDTSLNARIDNIIAGGAAPSEAEIIDARRGADGVNYASLGTAIRSQFSNVEDNFNNIYSEKNEINSVTGWKYSISDNHLTKDINSSGYWKTMLAPVSCIFIDGVATLKSGGLAGKQSQSIPSMAFIDENWDVLSVDYTTIAAPHSFSIDDVPSGAVYVVCHFANAFKFAFQSTDKTIKIAQADINTLDTEIADAGKHKIKTNFVDTTGYYDKNGSFVTYSSVKKCSVSVNEGEVYFLTSKNYYGLARAVFFASDSTFISSVYSGNDTALNENTKIVVPQNATTMIIQSMGSAVSDVKLYKSDLSERIDLLNNELQNVEAVTTQKTGTNVSLTFSATTGYYDKNKSFNTYGGVTVAKVSVLEGDQYLIDSRSYYNAAIACLLDSTDAIKSVIWISNNAAQQKNIEIDIPEGISYLLIQRFDNYKPTTLTKVTGIIAKPVQSLLSGKRVTLIGDSITELNLRAATNWALWINDWCNATIQNLGASGTGFIAGGANPYHNRIASISNPDIIGIAVSFNDMSNSISDLTTAAETFFDDLIDAYPTTPIICYVQSPWSSYHYGVASSDAWIDALRDVCNTRGVPFYDGMYKGTVLKPWLAANRAVYYINDGDGNTGEEDWVHPNSEGHKAIARYLYPKFVENLVAVGLDYNS